MYQKKQPRTPTSPRDSALRNKQIVLPIRRPPAERSSAAPPAAEAVTANPAAAVPAEAGNSERSGYKITPRRVFALLMALVLLLSLCACAQKMQTEHDEPKMNTAGKIIAAAEPDGISDTAGWVQQRHKRRTSMVSLSAVYFLKCRSCITYYISMRRASMISLVQEENTMPENTRTIIIRSQIRAGETCRLA